MMDKTIFPAWERALIPQKKRSIAEMAGLGMGFPRVPTHFNRWKQLFHAGHYPCELN